MVLLSMDSSTTALCHPALSTIIFYAQTHLRHLLSITAPREVVHEAGGVIGEFKSSASSTVLRGRQDKDDSLDDITIKVIT